MNYSFMHYTELIFTPKKTAAKLKGELQSAVELLLNALVRNYQIFGNRVTGWAGGILKGAVYVPRHDALSREYFSPWALESYEKVRNLCSVEPQFTILDDNAKRRYPKWQNAECLYLSTNLGDFGSPITGGKYGEAIPAYLLPLSQQDKENLFFWQATYRDYDNIWLRSTTLELPVYREMADPESEHSRKGRALCRIIEDATKLPTYYYLHRYWGRDQGERNRLCPLCGKDWVYSAGSGKKKDIEWFDFLCVADRIVSHIGVNTDEAHARIGEYRAPSSPESGGGS